MAMRIFYCFSFIFLFFFLESGSSQAAQYKIEIRQVNPDKWTYNAACEAESLCHVFMGIVPQGGVLNTDDLELDVGVFIKEKEAHFQFKSGSEYFFAGTADNNERIIQIRTDESRRVTLYARNPSAQEDPDGLYQLPVIRSPARMLAELEIKILPINPP